MIRQPTTRTEVNQVVATFSAVWRNESARNPPDRCHHALERRARLGRMTHRGIAGTAYASCGCGG